MRIIPAQTMKILLACFLSLIPLLAFSENFSKDADYTICFTPGENCTDLIIQNIQSAKETVLVQAYQLTSAPIAKALVDAKKRGISINVILDKSQYKENKFSAAKFFSDYGIPIWIDNRPAIAHNKVIIIDTKKVITGSFDFSKAAQDRNAENVIVITDPKIAKMYTENWKRRQMHAVVLADYHPRTKKHDALQGSF